MFKYYYEKLESKKSIQKDFDISLVYGATNIHNYFLNMYEKLSVSKARIFDILINFDKTIGNITYLEKEVNGLNNEDYIIKKIDIFMNYILNGGYIDNSKESIKSLNELEYHNPYIIFKIIKHFGTKHIFKTAINKMLSDMKITKQYYIIINGMIKLFNNECIQYIVSKFYHIGLLTPRYGVTIKPDNIRIFFEMLKPYLNVEIMNVDNMIIDTIPGVNNYEIAIDFSFINYFIKYGGKVNEATCQYILNINDFIPFNYILTIFNQPAFKLDSIRLDAKFYMKQDRECYNIELLEYLIKKLVTNDDFEKILFFYYIYNINIEMISILNWYYKNRYTKDKVQLKIRIGISMAFHILGYGKSIIFHIFNSGGVKRISLKNDEFGNLYNNLLDRISMVDKDKIKILDINNDVSSNNYIDIFTCESIYTKIIKKCKMLVDNILDIYNLRDIIYN
jgi:hypothetical protein